MIKKLKEQNFDIIFDDDNAGEIADVIAIKVDDVNKKVKVELFHLKFSQEDRPGARSTIYMLLMGKHKNV